MFIGTDIHRHLQAHGFAVESVVLDGLRSRDPARTVDLDLGERRVQVVLAEPVPLGQAATVRNLVASLRDKVGERARLRLVHPPLDPDLEPRVEFHRLRRPLADAEVQELLGRLRRQLPGALVELQFLPGEGGDV